MPSYPSISKGLGKLTPALFARLMGMLEWFEINKTTIEKSSQLGYTKKYFLAKITASVAIAATDNRYTYSWTEVVLDATTGFINRPNPLSGTTALNLCEMSNTGANVAPGIDILGSSYPLGFNMMAIGDCIDSVQVDTIVVMFMVRDEDGSLRQVFCLGNAHDGSCEAP
jgi:hypothetical protein